VKSVKTNIVEEYGRRRYIMDYIRFLTYSISWNDETVDHLEISYETASLTNTELYNDLHSRHEILGKKLNLFLQATERSRTSNK